MSNVEIKKERNIVFNNIIVFMGFLVVEEYEAECSNPSSFKPDEHQHVSLVKPNLKRSGL